jgi:hypothetical protein
VKTARARFSALVLAAAIFSAIGVPVFAGQIHAACAAKQHDCGKATRIASCCCGDQGDASSNGGPVESRVRLDPSLTFAPCVIATLDVSRLHTTHVRSNPSPPRASPLDRPTLFSSLLI